MAPGLVVIPWLAAVPAGRMPAPGAALLLLGPMRIGQVVIAGAGLAGLRAAEELRALEYQGSITMIGAERHPPYDRPPLTKKFMTGEIDGTSLRADFAALGVDLRLGETATGLRDGVLGTDQAEYRFDALVVATGATPVRLPGPGPQRVLRTIDDAAAIRSALRPGLKLAVVGAGWIGAELATSAAKKGCQVTVLEAAPAPLAGALGAEAGSRTVPWYSAAGVELRLGQPVESVEPGGVALPGGGWLAADEVVTAVGVRPEVGWLAGSGVLLENGVAVDEGLRASVPGVSTPRRWWRRTSSAAANCTTRCPTSGRSSSAGWSSTAGTTPAPTGWSGAGTRPGATGRRAGWPAPARTPRGCG